MDEVWATGRRHVKTSKLYLKALLRRGPNIFVALAWSQVSPLLVAGAFLLLRKDPSLPDLERNVWAGFVRQQGVSPKQSASQGAAIAVSAHHPAGLKRKITSNYNDFLKNNRHVYVLLRTANCCVGCRMLEAIQHALHRNLSA